MNSPEEPASTSGSLVRSFMVTGGRTTTESTAELSVETIVDRSSDGEDLKDELQFEARRVYDFLERPLSIAEIAAEFRLPIRAMVIIVSEMVAEGALAPADVVEEVDIDLLLRIRRGIEAL